MLPEERIAKILEIVSAQGSATVEQLAEVLEVSEMTVRRDLKKCKGLSSLRRCHGGAILRSELVGEVSYDQKVTENHAAKSRLAACCLSLVRSGSAVYLDAGTTTFCIAEQIRRVPDLTVVTNDLKIALYLAQHMVKTVLLGGEVQSSTCSVLGGMTLSLLRDIHLSTAFIGTTSINERFDTMTPTLEKVFLKRQMLASTEESYLVADSSKFHRQAQYRINNLAEYTAVVTNAAFSENEERLLRQKGIRLIVPDNA